MRVDGDDAGPPARKRRAEFGVLTIRCLSRSLEAFSVLVSDELADVRPDLSWHQVSEWVFSEVAE
jgi:hypothetical protein